MTSTFRIEEEQRPKDKGECGRLQCRSLRIVGDIPTVRASPAAQFSSYWWQHVLPDRLIDVSPHCHTKVMGLSENGLEGAIAQGLRREQRDQWSVLFGERGSVNFEVATYR
jgi:hypothetical protein